MSALMWASAAGNKDVVQALMKFQPKMRSADVNHPLDKQAHGGVQTLLPPLDVNAQDEVSACAQSFS